MKTAKNENCGANYRFTTDLYIKVGNKNLMNIQNNLKSGEFYPNYT